MFVIYKLPVILKKTFFSEILRYRKTREIQKFIDSQFISEINKENILCLRN